MRKLVYALAATLILGVSSVCAAPTGPAHIRKTTLGKVLTTPKGLTLYTFAKDISHKPNCNGKCARHWPPFLAAASAKPAGKWSLVKRTNGKEQWAYKGHPLYTWYKDHKPGQTTGNGLLKGAWHVAQP